MKKAYADLPTIISFLLGIVIYTTFLFPVMKNFLTPTGADDMTIGILGLAPAAVVIAMMISLFKYAFGSQGNAPTR